MTTPAPSLQDITRQALSFHQQGNLQQAELFYRQALELDAGNGDVLQLYGALKLQQGDLDHSEKLLVQALSVDPNCLQAVLNLGNIYTSRGQLEQAVDSYTRVLSIDPRSANAWINIANIRRAQGDGGNARSAYDKALDIQPEAVEALLGLATLDLDQGQIQLAQSRLSRCEQINSQHPQIYLLRARCFTALQKYTDAAIQYYHAASLAPNLFDAHFGAANLYYQIKRHKDAKLAYQRALALRPAAMDVVNNLANTLTSMGDYPEAIRLLEEMLAKHPEYAEGWNNLGMALQSSDKKDASVEPFRKAIELKPDYVEALSNLGQALVYIHKPLAAIEPLQQALAIAPDFVPAYYNLGYAYNQAGKTRESYTVLRNLLQRRPDLSSAHDTLLMYLAYDQTLSPEQQFEEHQRWGQMHGIPRQKLIKPLSNNKDPNRKLRIGYVSGDLGDHPVGRMSIAALEKHDCDQFEMVCYSGRNNEDDTSARFRQAAKLWRRTHGLSDQQIADQIREDGIDILVDLSGHTAGGKLTVFAQKPAPVQATWLGYCDTTGLDTIDYILMDETTVPASMDGLFTETVIRLPDTRFAYSPPPQAPDVAPAPALMNGYITFGSFNNLLKVTPEVIAVWSKILRAVPNSRLVINWMSLREIERCQSLAAQFAEHGIERARLEFLFLSGDRRQVLGEYSKVDIALDTFPYSGGITTSEALWMGVPVITLLGKRAVARQSAAIIQAAGFPHWIASSQDEFVNKAVALAGNVGSLYASRKLQRDQVARSKLLDASSFIRHLEHSYRQIWQRWCEQSA